MKPPEKVLEEWALGNIELETGKGRYVFSISALRSLAIAIREGNPTAVIEAQDAEIFAKKWYPEMTPKTPDYYNLDLMELTDWQSIRALCSHAMECGMTNRITAEWLVQFDSIKEALEVMLKEKPPENG